MRAEQVWKADVDRRQFLGVSGLGVAALTLASAGFSDRRTADRIRFARDPFALGVASGDPSPDGFVAWTRLAPYPLDEDGQGGVPDVRVPVRWQVAKDDGFRRVVRQGRTYAVPELAHSVHVELAGLASDRDYFYRFQVGDAVSPTGRSRTMPAPGSTPQTLAFAFASCQLYETGFFGAYRDMAEQDLDLVVHLGDYIYAETYLGDAALRPHEGPEVTDLTGYRRRTALYKTDQDLQAAHAAAPWLVSVDDHEVENNWADEVPESGSQTPTTELFLARRAAAFQAFYEHMPLRLGSKPQGPDMRLYRRYSYGDLAELSLLDTRQYRDDQANNQFPAGPRDPDSLDPDRTLTGPRQERWLLDGLAASPARWNVIANQIIMAQFDYDTGPGVKVNHDQWDGYVAARRRILDVIAEHRPANPVAITGDWHSSWVNDLLADFDDPESEVLATEFVGTSISSPCTWAADVARALPANPHVKFFDGSQRGYVRCTVTPQEWRADYRVVADVTEVASPALTLTSWVVEDGRPGAQPA